VRLVAADIDEELVADFLRAQPLARHFHLEDELFVLEEKVHSGRSSGVRRCPFLGADVIEVQAQERVEQVLNVVLVVELKRWPAPVTRSQLSTDAVKANEQVQEAAKRVALRHGASRHGWRVSKISLKTSNQLFENSGRAVHANSVVAGLVAGAEAPDDAQALSGIHHGRDVEVILAERVPQVRP
jgi:hypothetical protein